MSKRDLLSSVSGTAVEKQLIIRRWDDLQAQQKLNPPNGIVVEGQETENTDEDHSGDPKS